VPHYAAANVFVLPSLSETHGLVALESLWFAKPVIVTNRIVAARELVEDGGTASSLTRTPWRISPGSWPCSAAIPDSPESWVRGARDLRGAIAGADNQPAGAALLGSDARGCLREKGAWGF